LNTELTDLEENYIQESGHNEDSNESGLCVTEEELFPELQSTINNIIKLKFYGQTFIKLNWSAPIDAKCFMFDGRLCCKTAADIFLLLKSSSRISQDIERISKSNQPAYLLLRRYHEVKPSFEFRLFISHRKCLGISQRDIHVYFSFLENNLPSLRREVLKFLNINILPRVPQLIEFVIDVWVDSDRVWLIDFVPFAAKYCDSLLFEWEDLIKRSEDIKENLGRICVTNSEQIGSNLKQKDEDIEIRIVGKGGEVPKKTYY